MTQFKGHHGYKTADPDIGSHSVLCLRIRGPRGLQPPGKQFLTTQLITVPLGLIAICRNAESRQTISKMCNF